MAGPSPPGAPGAPGAGYLAPAAGTTAREASGGSSPAAALPAGSPRARARVALRHEAVLGALLAVEIVVFSITGHNFLTLANAMELVRVSTEIGLLTLALTPVIVTGGIDLSVGSLMGLCAVVFGLLTKEAGLPFGLSIAATLAVGAAGGLGNGLCITRLGLPPLIVTLGTYSLYRGLAEGLTQGVKNFTDFDPAFLDLGQSYLLGLVPAQLPVLALVAAAYFWLLHRSTIGRALYAIGFSAEGARHAGIPVEARLRLVYALSGLVASLAAVIYVAHLGQAKADAGTSYELMAITAVVLGGTSIFGGRGTIAGSLLGLFAIAVLQNGLRLSDQPTELAGILGGALLVGAILFHQVLSKRSSRS
jgi:rhamnose transport system permease protein